jgi:IclR family KDG regulon transcriptional repressor
MANEEKISITVAKALGIVDVLAAHAGGGLTLAELAKELGSPKSTVHRYLATLMYLGLAERSGDDRYRLGVKVVELAGYFLANSDLRNESQGVMESLSLQTGETVHLAVPSGMEVVYIAKVDSMHAVTMQSHIGARLPMHSTSLGKSILAFGPLDRTGEVLGRKLKVRTPLTITSRQALESELETIRARGYAIDNEENEPGVRCVSAPIFDYMWLAVAALSVSGPSSRLSKQRCVEMAPLVCEAARTISTRIGCPG